MLVTGLDRSPAVTELPIVNPC